MSATDFTHEEANKFLVPPAQEYLRELNAIADAFRQAQDHGFWYAVETKYGWVSQARKPSLRFGKIWECSADGNKYYG